MPIKKYLYSILSCIVIIMAMLFIGSYKFVDGFRDIPRTQPIVNVDTTQAKKAMDASAGSITNPVTNPVTNSGPFPIGYKNPDMNSSVNPSTIPSANSSANSVYEKDIAALQTQIAQLQAQINAITSK